MRFPAEMTTLELNALEIIVNKFEPSVKLSVTYDEFKSIVEHFADYEWVTGKPTSFPAFRYEGWIPNDTRGGITIRRADNERGIILSVVTSPGYYGKLEAEDIDRDFISLLCQPSPF
jgi:hypothetical protein